MIGHPPAFGGSLRASKSIDLTSRSRLKRQARSRPTYARLRPDRGRLGRGPIPAEADATIELGAAQAEAIQRGQLHPLEALMTGELRLAGDLGLILQIQAIAMTASLAR